MFLVYNIRLRQLQRTVQEIVREGKGRRIGLRKGRKENGLREGRKENGIRKGIKENGLRKGRKEDELRKGRKENGLRKEGRGMDYGRE